jgi:hypothetical protein
LPQSSNGNYKILLKNEHQEQLYSALSCSFNFESKRRQEAAFIKLNQLENVREQFFIVCLADIIN